jgi:hypothetical protein
MLLIFPSPAANTITAKSAYVFVQYAVLDIMSDQVLERVLEEVSDQVPERVLGGVLDKVPEAEAWCIFSL